MNTFVLTSQKIGLSLTIRYDKGYLKSFEMDFKTPLNPEQADLLFKNIPYKEQYLQRLVNIGFKTTVAMPTNEKIALFCRLYEKHVNVKYKVSPSDAGKMKHIQLTEQMLQHYFTTPMFQIKGKYSVSNLVRYYNELMAEIAQKGKPRFPNTWSQEVAAKLSGPDLSAYYAHLRSLGLRPKKDKNGNITDFII